MDVIHYGSTTAIPRAIRPYLLSSREMPWQPRFSISIWLPSLLPRHVIDPPLIRPQRLSSCNFRDHIHPAERVADRMHLVTNMRPRVFAHPIVQILISHKVVEMPCHGFVIAALDEVAALAVFDL